MLILLGILGTLRFVPVTIPKNLEVWLSNWLVTQRISTNFNLVLLLGDGSSRSFYRALFSDRSFIIVSDPVWTQTQDYPAHQSFLKKIGIPVPDFFVDDPKNGFLLMEDLGDELLQHRINSSQDKKFFWLEKATILLAELHGKSYPVPPKLPVFSRSFDQKKYFDELSFTFEHLHQKLLGLSAPDIALNQNISDFCKKIASVGPSVFAHRDYHCRNLLVKNESLMMIDFQDARMGSPHYDLCSLLYDAYIDISEIEKNALLQIYEKTLRTYPVFQSIDWKNFESSMKNIAFQRTLKAAGSFASFYTRFGKDSHLGYIIPALKSALALQKTGYGFSFDLERWIALVGQLNFPKGD